jgi:GTP cyclohydrolase FolE2
MNAPECCPLPDTQAETDHRQLPIQRVGVKGVRYPLNVHGENGHVQPTVADFTLTVSLPHTVKGTHMSRFVEWL